MSSDNQKVVSIIENTITQAIQAYCTAESLNLTSDLYLQADYETGELQLFDEEENSFAKVTIFDWVNSPSEKEFYTQIIPLLKKVLSAVAAKEVFENSCFVKPFSINLTDDEFNVVEELLFLDDETFRLDDPLLKDLDKELDDFLSDLLSDID